ncbi:alkaline phosphatase family protein [Lysobacter pythonis]|uniref:Alkaline phosphatase family protein n=1 Tax=Solilutibacter pythonis TaxID=2483112 RepID=A0A3M2HUZ4_9GAMM|nr:alkaline phosphatase D family protein [Lysobacter pythonis]RMH93556.1 alkaline phosphatase family protein [Lysobacter pythonis]
MNFLKTWVCGLLLLLPVTAPAWLPPPSADTEIARIAFGSCSRESLPQPVWSAVLERRPDMFVFLGDNIYGDTRDMRVLRRKYRQLSEIEGIERLRANVPVLATWDDHDYGEDDAGADYPMKEESRKIFLDFWGEPAGSPRRARDGVYTSHAFGPEGRRVQVILLDLRYNRTPLLHSPFLENESHYSRWARQRERQGYEVHGPYARNPDPAATMLGERQWRWFERQLREPADLRIIGSSLQVVSDFPGWEAWANYPADQQRLYETIRKTRARGVVFLSGDTHFGELSVRRRHVPYPMYDLTSSGLTEVWRVPVPNALRVDGKSFRQVNFGELDIDWTRRTLTMRLRDVNGGELLGRTLEIDALADAAWGRP